MLCGDCLNVLGECTCKDEKDLYYDKGYNHALKDTSNNFEIYIDDFVDKLLEAHNIDCWNLQDPEVEYAIDVFKKRLGLGARL